MPTPTLAKYLWTYCKPQPHLCLSLHIDGSGWFVRKAGALRLDGSNCLPEDFERILACCPALTDVDTYRMNTAMLAEIRQQFGETLERLNWWNDSVPIEFAPDFLKKCPNLVHMYLCSKITDALIQRIATCCPLLRYGLFGQGYGSTIDATDVGMKELFTKCKQLKRLTFFCNAPHLTYSSLQTLLDQRLVLQTMSFVYQAKDVLRFLAAAKEQGLLPLPTIHS